MNISAYQYESILLILCDQVLIQSHLVNLAEAYLKFQITFLEIDGSGCKFYC